MLKSKCFVSLCCIYIMSYFSRNTNSSRWKTLLHTSVYIKYTGYIIGWTVSVFLYMSTSLFEPPATPPALCFLFLFKAGLQFISNIFTLLFERKTFEWLITWIVSVVAVAALASCGPRSYALTWWRFWPDRPRRWLSWSLLPRLASLTS